MNYFRYKQFNKDVITVAVGYYLRYALSYRDISEILRERGVNVHHSTIYRWVQEYAPILYQIWKKKHKKAYYKWRVDETYIKIKGKWCYLYRAIDADGHTLDIWLRKKRDNHSAYAFIKRLIKQFGKPQMIISYIFSDFATEPNFKSEIYLSVIINPISSFCLSTKSLPSKAFLFLPNFFAHVSLFGMNLQFKCNT